MITPSKNRFFLASSVFFLITVLLSAFYGLSGSGVFTFQCYTFVGLKFVFFYFLCFTGAILLFFFFRGEWDYNTKFSVLLLIAAVSRAAFIFQEPSDDIYRYIWEGIVFNKGYNPYILSPDNPVLSDLKELFPFHYMINHKDVTAAYPPFIILLFAFITKISHSVYLSKTIITIFDFFSIIFLIRVLKNRETDIRWAVLYALNPLVLYSFAGGGHIDAIQNFFLIFSLYLYDRKRWGLCFIMLGMALQVKFVAVLALPFFVKKKNFRFLLFFIFTLIVFYVPFSGDGILSLFKGLYHFYGNFGINGPIHTLLRYLTGDLSLSTSITRYLFIIVFLVITLKIIFYEREKDPVKGIFLSFGSLIILTPTLHIWYICWILPFALIRTKASWIVLTLSCGFYYVSLSLVRIGNIWDLPLWVVFSEWAPFFIFFIFEFYYSLRRAFKKPFRKPVSISVIIPVLNEEENIERCIESIKTDKSVDEIIVVDGGSADNTITEAAKKECRIIVNSKSYKNGGGRGGQILSGIKAAGSDIIAVVHADTIVEEKTFSRLIKYLEKNKDVVGGAVGTGFEDGTKMKFIELLNSIRAVFFGISFGDQIQFFRSEVKGIFPDVPLMEDVELSIRLPKEGRVAFLFGGSHVSSRRWKKRGVKNFFQIVSIFLIYLLKRIFVMPDTAKIYKKYYLE